jgi:hypothetical protein
MYQRAAPSAAGLFTSQRPGLAEDTTAQEGIPRMTTQPTPEQPESAGA